MATRIQLRRDSSLNWSTNNPILAEGEIGIELLSNKIKIGDGITSWNSLNYVYSEKIINDNLLGSIDGTNNIFIIDNNILPDTEELFVNGIKLLKPNDYNISESTITLNFSPNINENLTINYIKQ